MRIGNTGSRCRSYKYPCTRFYVKSVPGKISVRLCGMFNRAGLREVAKGSFEDPAKRISPCGMQARTGRSKTIAMRSEEEEEDETK
jgi:hypothetical protein